MPTGFDPGRGNYTSIDPSLRFEMTRSGGNFFQTGILTTPQGEKKASHKIDLIYGANHQADEVFFSWQGEHLDELMAVWLHPSNRWANTSYDHRGSGTFTRVTTIRCVECHNTWVAQLPGSTNQYNANTAVLGVTCERCHGPAHDHVEYHQAHPEQKVAKSIVHPGKLPRERLLEVCTQCHSNAIKPREPGFSYRPGEQLDAFYRTAITRYPEEDHVANQIKYLRQSKCFQKSDTLTCVTCHDPHRPHDTKAVESTRAACLTCHSPEKCRDRPNLPAGVRDDCVSCHMAPRVWMNVHFHTSDDRYVPPIRRFQHRIAIDPVARKETLMAWHRTQPGEDNQRQVERLTGELVAYWLGEAESRRSAYRFLAAIGASREALRLSPSQPDKEKALASLQTSIATQTKIDTEWIEARHAADEGRVPTAIATLNRILEVKPDWAVVHSKLGTLYAMTGQTQTAVKHLEQVAQHDPDNASGLAMLAWLAYLQDRPADASELFRQANDIEPRDAKINYHWGLSLLKLGRWAEAANRFRRVVAIDPHHAGGYQGLSHSLREQGQATDALRFARRAARLTDFRNADVLVTLAEAYSAASRSAEAAVAARKALDAADATPENALDRDTRRRMQMLHAKAKPR
jgi:tetratricopeptide (TPR) repeat protein